MKSCLLVYLKNILCTSVFVLACASSVNAQMIETIDFSLPGHTYNTYVNDINKRGDVCGYYTLSTGVNVGFIITSHGKRISINPLTYTALSSYTNTKVTGINDHGVAVIYASGPTNSIFKAYVDSTTDSISNIVAVSGVAEATAVPFKINNLDDITGWFSGSTRYFFILHDSIIPSGAGKWEATRYEDASPAFYNTEAGGINNANTVAGFYIDGAYTYPYLYNDATGFNIVSSPYSTHFWAINNSNVVVGEYKQTSGIWMAFSGTVSGSSLTINSLKNIFYSAGIQSVANGINDNGDIVGSFVHPVRGNSIGFIYHPNVSEYHIPGFSYETGTWSMVNSNTGTNPIWSSNYWAGANYATYDPYANVASPPLLDSFILKQYTNPAQLINAMTDSISPSWKGFCTEIDALHVGTSTSSFAKAYYESIAKHAFWNKFLSIRPKNSFGGYCYGFAYSSLIRYFDDVTFSSWFGLPAGTDISTIDNVDKIFVRAIERCWLKQFDKTIANDYPIVKDGSVWEGLYRLKNTYRLPFKYCNPRAITISFTPAAGGGYHTVLPYKIRTPQTLPFDYPSIQYDTMFVYDSNYPNDSSQHFNIYSGYEIAGADSIHSIKYAGQLKFMSFSEVSVREMLNTQYSTMRLSGISPDIKYLNFSLQPNLYFIINDTGGTRALQNATGFNNTSPNLTPLNTKEITSSLPNSFDMDTSYSVTATTYHYADSLMNWIQSNTNRAMSLSRPALPSESDNTTIKNRFISYGNHDAVTKTLTGSYTETTDDMTKGSSILVSGICAMEGDSIVTKNPYPFAYQVIRENGTSSCSYDLTVFAAYGDSVREFHATIPLPGTTSHIIDPYYPLPGGGYKTVIYEDKGLTGSSTDTIFVAGSPSDVRTITNNTVSINAYPNPVYLDKNLNIDINSVMQTTYHIAITNILGVVMYRNTVVIASGSVTIPMSAYVPGIYVLQVTDDRGITLYQNKIMKE
ncbi:MAG TPA: T9SS type A sorting domain-containing protein [Flavipsychrobacter sp.]|nr:T9SS type A sorting domain-containing protein [Flavipsychrobacter sp.]